MRPLQKVIIFLPQGRQRFSQRAPWIANNIFILCERCGFFVSFVVNHTLRSGLIHKKIEP